MLGVSYPISWVVDSGPLGAVVALTALQCARYLT